MAVLLGRPGQPLGVASRAPAWHHMWRAPCTVCLLSLVHGSHGRPVAPCPDPCPAPSCTLTDREGMRLDASLAGPGRRAAEPLACRWSSSESRFPLCRILPPPHLGGAGTRTSHLPLQGRMKSTDGMGLNSCV